MLILTSRVTITFLDALISNCANSPSVILAVEVKTWTSTAVSVFLIVISAFGLLDPLPETGL